MILTTDDLYKIAYGKYAIGAYNIDNLEQMLGLFPGCIESQIPFTIQLSKGTRQYAEAMPATNLFKKMWPSPNGWSSGCRQRHSELGRVGGVEEDVQVEEGGTFLTDAQEAVEFVTETDCDSSAAGFQMLAGQ